MDTSLDVIPNPQTKILPENVTNIGDRAIKAAIVNHLLGIIIKDPSAKELLRQAHSDIVGELITLSTKRSDLNIKTILREMDYNLSIHNQNGSSNLTYDREILKELLNSLKLIINAYIKKTTSTDSVPKIDTAKNSVSKIDTILEQIEEISKEYRKSEFIPEVVFNQIIENNTLFKGNTLALQTLYNILSATTSVKFTDSQKKYLKNHGVVLHPSRSLDEFMNTNENTRAA